MLPTTDTPPAGRVFLIAQPSVTRDGRVPDISDLYRFGEVRVLLDAREYDNVGNSNAGHALQRLITRLQDYDPERDYIVWAGGDTTAALMVGAALFQIGVDAVQWLRFERPRDAGTGRRYGDKQYIPYLVPLAGEPVGSEDELEPLPV